jgi:glycosyltransferase involved in cell wall biosynthesis
MRVLRVYHAGRDPAHRRRERALVEAGVDVRLVVPTAWPDAGSEPLLGEEPFDVVQLEVARPGDVNRHRCVDGAAMRELMRSYRPDVLDVHEEPFSIAARQWLAAAGSTPVVMYTAQNLDKRFPPRFAQYETNAYQQVRALYPCSRQAASVARGKGFRGPIDVLPLGIDRRDFPPGDQRHEDAPFVLGLVGRLVPEKGVRDAVRVLAAVNALRPCRLRILGEGPELEPALRLAAELGVVRSVDVTGWRGVAETARAFAAMHVLLVPSRSTATWVEQFGRVILEGQASGCVVAGYDSGAIAEVGAGAARLVPEGDVAGFGAAACELAGDAALWQRLRRDGLGHSQERTWHQVALGQRALYEKALAGGNLPAQVGPILLPELARAAAREEFGPPARTPVAERPLALPVLRTSPVLNSVIGRVIDLTAAGWRSRAR